MKKLTRRLTLAVFCGLLVSVSGCYDDTDVQNRLNDHERRISALETLCKELNTNISSVGSIVRALQENDYVTSVSTIVEGGKEVGYTLNFAKSGAKNIYHGKDGANGTNGTNGQDGHTPVIGVREDGGSWYWTVDGQWLLDAGGNRVKANGTDGVDGTNGTNGQDGHTPVIGIREESGVWYWTVDGQWLLDDAGNKVQARGVDGDPGAPGAPGTPGDPGTPGENGEDGITPQLKIEEDYWWVSYDEGETWEKLGKATGENGTNGTNGITPQLKIVEDYWYISTDEGKTWEKLGKATGKDGDSMFRSVNYNDVLVYLTLKDGTVLRIPRERELRVSFNYDDVKIANEGIGWLVYNVESYTGAISIDVVGTSDLRVFVERTDDTSGSIAVDATGNKLRPDSKIVVIVSDAAHAVVQTFKVLDMDRMILVNARDYDNLALVMRREADDTFVSPVFQVSQKTDLELINGFNQTIGFPDGALTVNGITDEPIEIAGNFLIVPAGYYELVVTMSDPETVAGVEARVYHGGGDFPDPQFRKFVFREFDWTGDGLLSPEEYLGVTYLDVLTDDIYSMEGLRFFPNLHSLSCTNVYGCGLLTILNLSGNPELERLYCDGNQLLSLDLRNNPKLTFVNCSANRIRNLVLVNNPVLEILECSNNDLTSLDLDCPALETLSCNKNALPHLVLNACPNLKKLYCYDNKIEYMDVSGCTQLEIIDIEQNQLKGWEFNLPALKTLDCANNQLQYFYGANSPLLTSLNCRNNDLHDLYLVENPNMEYLDCRVNKNLKYIDLSVGQVIPTVYKDSTTEIRYK